MDREGPLTLEKTKHRLIRLLAIRQLANLIAVHIEGPDLLQDSRCFPPLYYFIGRWLLTTLHNRPIWHYYDSALLIDIAFVKPAENHVLIVLAPANTRYLRRLQLASSFAAEISPMLIRTVNLRCLTKSLVEISETLSLTRLTGTPRQTWGFLETGSIFSYCGGFFHA